MAGNLPCKSQGFHLTWSSTSVHIENKIYIFDFFLVPEDTFETLELLY